MKVAIFTDTFLPNKDGVVVSICNLIKGLIKKHWEVVVFAPGEKTKLEYVLGAKVYYIKGIDLAQYPGYKIVLPDKFLSKILAYLEIENPDIHHIHSPFFMGWAGILLASSFKKPIVGTFHTYLEDYAGYLINGKLQEFAKKFFKFSSWQYFRLFFLRCSKVIAPTNEIADILRKQKFKNVVTVPSAVDFDALDKPKREDIRKKHRIPKHAKIVLYVGRLGFEKRLNVLFDAFKTIDKENYLILVGKGPFEKKYKDYVSKKEIKHVIFTGYVDDEKLPSYYNACDVFVSPSDTETQGLTFIEAMHFKKPVIGADKLGVKETITDGKTGLKFTPGDSKELAEKMMQILADKQLSKRLGTSAKIFSKHFSIDQSTKKMLKVYENAKYIKPYHKRLEIVLNKRFKSILKLG